MVRVLVLMIAFCLTTVTTRLQAQTPKPPVMRDKTAAEPSPDDFIEIDVEPQPLTTIQSLIRYPEEARRRGLEGKVETQALIEKDGTVSKVEILKSSDIIFEAEARRAMLSARFTPAKQKNKPLRVWMTYTINFRLSTPIPDIQPPVHDDNASSPTDRPSVNPK